MRRTIPTVLALAFTASAFWLTVGPTGAHAGDEQVDHLRYRKTYADALLESRIRNVPVLVTRHKDD